MAKTTRKKVKEVEQVIPEFDPSKRYRWTPEDKFEMSGVEFAILLNYVMSKRQQLLQDLEATSLLEQKLKEAVEAGKATEVVEEAK